MGTATDRELASRALVAWYRSRKTPGRATPAAKVTDHDGLRYVVLSAPRGGTLTVYRVRNDGRLKELRRWPKHLD
jgi:hypothetical protein